ncbi:MAG: ketol-acid reductoisomerase [Gammaproteobacteria bacterium]
MALKSWTDREIDAHALDGQRVIVFGYGAQGRAHAQNLRDSGVDVAVGLRESSQRRARAADDDIAVVGIADGAAQADLAVLLVPDEVQPELYDVSLAPKLKKGAALLFAHGYNIHYARIMPRADLDVLLVAPKGIGDQVRATYAAGHGVPGLVAVQQDASGVALERALGYARAVGHGRAVVLETTFADETETDLFGEQAVLCGGITALANAGFDTLVDAGYPAELAYFECLHEIKLIADLMYARGIAGMRESISSTAAFGDCTRGPRLIDASVRASMRLILEEIRSGAFARELAAEVDAGYPALGKAQATARADAIEAVGAALRARMAFLGASHRKG